MASSRPSSSSLSNMRGQAIGERPGGLGRRGTASSSLTDTTGQDRRRTTPTGSAIQQSSSRRPLRLGQRDETPLQPEPEGDSDYEETEEDEETDEEEAYQALVDAKFHRAVDIIQSLPKNGPISTSYEEKLMLYSLYKQGMSAITDSCCIVNRPDI